MRLLINHLTKNSTFYSLSPRNYVTALFESTSTISARIKHRQDIVHLQALTSNSIGFNLHGGMTIREHFLGSAWHTLLKIDNRKQGIFYEETYLDRTSRQNVIKIFPPEQIIFPKVIFGVPQSIWESFIACLDHQEVVRLLNLKQHRHLWPAYRYALSAPTDQLIIARAQLIGRFHFLLSVALYHPDDIKQCHHDRRQEFCFPILSVLKQDLDNGEFSKKNMEKFHHCLTLIAVNKLRHCSNIFDLTLLATMISNYARTTRAPLERHRERGAINMLPSSENEPYHFFSALKFARIANKISTRSGLLFFNSQQQWGQNFIKEEKLEQLGSYYFDALFHDLIKRQILLKAHALNVFVNQDILSLVKELFESLFLQEITMNRVEALQTYWQHNAHKIVAIKPIVDQARFWAPLIASTQIDGISICSLASEVALVQHGRVMRHCVQTDVFIACCRSMEADILELVSEDGEMSTLDLRPDRVGGYYILQHVGLYGNKPPSPHHLSVGIKLLEGIQTGRIKLSESRRLESLDQQAKPNYQFDYNLDDVTTQESVYQCYKYNKMLPPRLIYDSYAQMLENTKLANMIEDVLTNTSETVLTPLLS